MSFSRPEALKRFAGVLDGKPVNGEPTLFDDGNDASAKVADQAVYLDNYCVTHSKTGQAIVLLSPVNVLNENDRRCIERIGFGSGRKFMKFYPQSSRVDGCAWVSYGIDYGSSASGYTSCYLEFEGMTIKQKPALVTKSVGIYCIPFKDDAIEKPIFYRLNVDIEKYDLTFFSVDHLFVYSKNHAIILLAVKGTEEHQEDYPEQYSWQYEIHLATLNSEKTEITPSHRLHVFENKLNVLCNFTCWPKLHISPLRDQFILEAKVNEINQLFYFKKQDNEVWDKIEIARYPCMGFVRWQDDNRHFIAKYYNEESKQKNCLIYDCPPPNSKQRQDTIVEALNLLPRVIEQIIKYDDQVIFPGISLFKPEDNKAGDAKAAAVVDVKVVPGIKKG